MFSRAVHPTVAYHATPVKIFEGSKYRSSTYLLATRFTAVWCAAGERLRTATAQYRANTAQASDLAPRPGHEAGAACRAGAEALRERAEVCSVMCALV